MNLRNLFGRRFGRGASELVEAARAEIALRERPIQIVQRAVSSPRPTDALHTQLAAECAASRAPYLPTPREKAHA